MEPTITGFKIININISLLGRFICDIKSAKLFTELRLKVGNRKCFLHTADRKCKHSVAAMKSWHKMCNQVVRDEKLHAKCDILPYFCLLWMMSSPTSSSLWCQIKYRQIINLRGSSVLDKTIREPSDISSTLYLLFSAVRWISLTLWTHLFC